MKAFENRNSSADPFLRIANEVLRREAEMLIFPTRDSRDEEDN